MVNRNDQIPLPVISAWDPRATSSGSIDPLGALRAFTAIATTILPGVTTITTRVRYLSWICAGLRLLDETSNAPAGGRAGRERRRRLLAWERLVALATGMHAKAVGVAEDDPAWRQLRGVSYVRRYVSEGVTSPKFPMLRNQAGVGGVGTYWVALVAGGLVEENSGQLTPRGEALGDVFLKSKATPDRAKLRAVLAGKTISFPQDVLSKWGRVAHLGAASRREKALLADALLEPGAHRRMAVAMQDADATTSEGESFRGIEQHLRLMRDPLANRLASVVVVAEAFENLHRSLLHHFNQILAVGHRLQVQMKDVTLSMESVPPLLLGEELKAALTAQAEHLPATVAEAARKFSLAMEPAVQARNDQGLIGALVRHHERVQGGKLDASRLPKVPWVKLQGSILEVAPRYALAAPPEAPSVGVFTHPYRIEQFAGMLREADAWRLAK